MLTPRQQDILNFIGEYSRENGFPPSVREIGSRFGIYPATVQDHIAALERKGYLQRKRHQSRTLAVSGPARRQASTTEVPVVGRVAAGRPVLAQENIDDVVQLPGGWAPAGGFLLKVTGDSMVGAHILDGDYVLVQPQSQAASGEIVVAMIGDEATVKRYHRTGNSVTLQAENPNYAPIDIDPEHGDSFRLIGRVVGVFRVMKRK